MELFKWPRWEEKECFTLAVAGDPDQLRALTEEKIQGKPVRVVGVGNAADLRRARPDALLINHDEPKAFALGKEAERLNREGHSTLIAQYGDSRPPENLGLRLLEVEGRERFTLNVDRVRKARLRVSPRLTKVASGLETDRGFRVD
ncbi:MAG: YfiR family protein [Candidatus Eremiobacteraeota bacterium]|nr:YfiR family protein [Candidatus Eremiobacteraeota bacterium]